MEKIIEFVERSNMKEIQQFINLRNEISLFYQIIPNNSPYFQIKDSLKQYTSTLFLLSIQEIIPISFLIFKISNLDPPLPSQITSKITQTMTKLTPKIHFLRLIFYDSLVSPKSNPLIIKPSILFPNEIQFLVIINFQLNSSQIQRFIELLLLFSSGFISK